jgi:hypothetical protein
MVHILKNSKVSRKTFFRRIRYHLTRPKPPLHPLPFRGPALVVGSAPVSHLPEGFDDTFSVITVNGAQAVTKAWGIDTPDATFLQYNQVYGTNANAVAVRNALKGKRTRILYVLRWNQGMKELIDGLQSFDYAYDKLELVSRDQRTAFLQKVTGILNFEEDTESKFSNGITAVLYALLSGAKTVIISGINPASAGHVYNNLELARNHSQTDKDVLLYLRAQGYAIYTADPSVSEAIGLPLWKAPGKAAQGSA